MDFSTPDYMAFFQRRKMRGYGQSGGQLLRYRYTYPIFKGRGGRRRRFKKIQIGGRRRRISRGKRRRGRKRGKGIVSFAAKNILPFLRRIPELFRSKAARKIASTVAGTSAATGLNVLQEKLSNRKKPLKKIAREQGTASGMKLLERAKTEIGKRLPVEGSGSRRRRRRHGMSRMRRGRIIKLRGGRRRRRRRKVNRRRKVTGGRKRGRRGRKGIKRRASLGATSVIKRRRKRKSRQADVFDY
jgi:hypothetical protein